MKKIILSIENRKLNEELTDEFVENFKLSPTEKRVIETLYKLRVADTKDLQKLVGYKNYYSFAEMLRRLYINRFVDRKMRPYELRKETKGKNGERQLYYLLDIAGAKFLKNQYGLKNLSELNWNKSDNLVQYNYMAHDIKASSCIARLIEVAKEQNKIKFELLEYKGEKHLGIKYELQGKKYKFNPDIWFRFNVNGIEKTIFCEIDMGTMMPTSGLGTSTVAFDKKVAHYENYLELIKDSMDYHHRKKIIVLTTDSKRAERLAAAVKKKQQEINKNRAIFLFTTFDKWFENPMIRCFIDTSFDKSDTNTKLHSFIE